MPPNSRSPASSRTSQRHTRTPTLNDSMPWIAAYPVAAFVAVTFGVFVFAFLVWFISVYWPFQLFGPVKASSLENASGIVQALIGTALVGASALVAIVIANSATNIAKAGLKESETNNTINNPDYLSAKAALRGYQKFAFLTGELLAIFRLHQQEEALREYQAATEAQTHGSTISYAEPLPWQATLREMQNLLFHVDFLAITYELARYLDDRVQRGQGAAAGFSRVQELRKNVAGMAATIERYLESRQGRQETADMILFQLMARTQLLSQQMRDNIRELRTDTDQDLFPVREEYPGLYFFSDWLAQIPSLVIDRDFEEALDQPLADLAIAEFPYSIGDQIYEVMNPDYECPDETDFGIHQGSLVVSFVGDQSSVIEAERCAHEAALKMGWTPRQGWPKPEDEEGVFHIITVKPEQLHSLLARSKPAPHARGVIIIDGVRLPGLVAEPWDPPMENTDSESPEADSAMAGHDPMQDFGIKAAEPLCTLHDFVATYANQAWQNSAVEAPYKADRRFVWVGIDYRAFGAPPEPASFEPELWAILGRSRLLAGADVGKLTGSDTRTFSSDPPDLTQAESGF